MDDRTGGTVQQQTGSILILPALTASRITPQARSILTQLLLIEIGQTFGTSIGLTNQLKTFTSVAAIAAALLMGFLSVRVKHRSLMMLGLSLSIVSTLGCYFAPSFVVLILFYSLGGLATSTIIPMTTALMGELIPLHERSKALGWLVAGPAALYLVGYPLVDRIGDWRKAFLLFALPIILLALVLTSIGIPSSESTPRKDDIFAGYRGILASRSAMACLISRGLCFGVWQIYLSLAASNLRQQFSMSRGLVSYLAIFQSLAYIAGALFARKIISRFGRRDSTLYLSALLGLSTILRFNVAYLAVAIVVGLIVCLLARMWNTSSQSLNLEQLPGLRGPMMSMTSAFGSTGNALSLSLGGLLLIQYGWGVMGATIGVFGILAAIVLFSFAHDPTRT